MEIPCYRAGVKNAVKKRADSKVKGNLPRHPNGLKTCFAESASGLDCPFRAPFRCGAGASRRNPPRRSGLRNIQHRAKPLSSQAPSESHRGRFLCRSNSFTRQVNAPGRTCFHRDGLADVAPAREIPSVGETGTLRGFRGLHAAVAAIEEDAFAITPLPFVQKSEALAI